MKTHLDYTNVRSPSEQHLLLARQQKRWITEASNECDNDLKLAEKYKAEKDKYSPIQQHHMMSELQKQWSNDAKRDADYLEERALMFKKQGLLVLERGYLQEVEWSRFWSVRRKGLSKVHADLAKTDNTNKLILNKSYMQEYRWCKFWVSRRTRLEKYHEMMAKKER